MTTAQPHEIAALNFVFDDSYGWCFNASGQLHRDAVYDALHCEAETRITYCIHRDIVDETGSCTLVVSNDSDCHAISLLNTNLRQRNIVHKVSDQYIYIDHLHDILDPIGLSAEHITRAFVIGGCDFMPFLKTISQATFAPVIIKYCDFFSTHVRTDGAQGSPSTSLLVALAYHHRYSQANSSNTIKRHPQLPAPSSPSEQLSTWIATFRVWQNNCISAISLHDLMPYPDGMHHHHERAEWILKYWDS